MELEDLTATSGWVDVNVTMVTDLQDVTVTKSQPKFWLLLCESISLALIMLASLVANTVAIVTILRLRSLQNIPHHLLVLNLSVADLGITFTSMSFALYSVFDGGALLQSSPILCKVNGFLATTFTLVNFPTVLAIAVDRFLIVVCSSRFPPNRGRIVIMITFSWCVALLTALLPAVNLLSEYSYSPNTWHCSPSWGDHSLFRISCAIGIFGLAIPMVAVCYAAIVYFIWTKQKLLRSYSIRESSAFRERMRKSRGKRTSSNPMASGYQSTMASQYTLSSPSKQPITGAPHCDVTVKAAKEAYERGGDQLATLQPLHHNRDFQGKSQLYQTVGGAVATKNGSMNGTRAKAMAAMLADSSWEDSDVINEGEKERKTREVNRNQLSADKRVAIMGALLVFTTLVCWMPYLLVHSNYIRVSDGHWFAVFTMLLGYSNAIMDPLIYTFINKRARKECKRYLKVIRPFSRPSLSN